VTEATTLSPKLTSEDRGKLDQYLTKRAQRRKSSWIPAAAPLECQKRDAARKQPPTTSTRLGAMMDVMEFAFRCDLTRVVSFGFGNAFGPGPMPWIGIGDDYHALTHRQ